MRPSQEQAPPQRQTVSEIKHIHSADLVLLGSDGPPDPDNCCIGIEIDVGLKDEPGANIFQIVVVTPSWLADHVADDRPLFARHHLIVKRFDDAVVKRAIYDRFEGVHGIDWAEVAERLARYGHWEFEDSQPYSATDGA